MHTNDIIYELWFRHANEKNENVKQSNARISFRQVKYHTHLFCWSFALEKNNIAYNSSIKKYYSICIHLINLDCIPKHWIVGPPCRP